MQTINQSPHSTSSSPMDNVFILSEYDYAEHVAAQNNMEVEVSHTSPPLDTPSYNFSLSPFQPPHVSNKEALNPVSNSNINRSMEPSSPTVIPYSTNILADPSLWDSNFMATFLFGTNKFLHRDMCNMACSLQHIVCFLKQRSLTGHNGNNIAQLKLFRICLCHDSAKQLSYFPFCFVLFYLVRSLLRWSVGKYNSHIVTKCEIGHITVTSHTKCHGHSHNMWWGRHIMGIRTIGGYCTATVVKCISSVQNQIGTLLSSSCQLRLGVDLSHLG